VAPERTLKAAAVQLSSQADVSQNLAACRTLVREAAGAGAELVLLPENFAYFGDDLGRARHAERLGDLSAPIQGALAAMARESGVTVVGGGFPEVGLAPDRPYNTAVMLSPAGQLVASYRKVHLFDVTTPDGIEYHESRTTSPGSELSVANVGGAEVGLSICYDVRFPELYRGLVDRGAEVILLPAAFTLATGKDHWHVLLRARAIESLSWVVAAAQWGSHPGGRLTYGHSLIVDPWGTIVAECLDQVGLVVADLDLGYLDEVRERLPCLRHRQSSVR
jgi:deaminated glutathione amidase